MHQEPKQFILSKGSETNMQELSFKLNVHVQKEYASCTYICTTFLQKVIIFFVGASLHWEKIIWILCWFSHCKKVNNSLSCRAMQKIHKRCTLCTAQCIPSYACNAFSFSLNPLTIMSRRPLTRAQESDVLSLGLVTVRMEPGPSHLASGL